jgi:hypothetical protein
MYYQYKAYGTPAAGLILPGIMEGRGVNPMTSIAARTEPRVRRWTRDEYYRMGRIGLFENQRVELIGGEVIQMSPQASPHAVATA